MTNCASPCDALTLFENVLQRQYNFDVTRRRSRAAMSTAVSLHVDMMCEGCAGAVRRLAAKIDGVTDVDVRLDAKTVIIRGAGLSAEDVREKIAKCGRETRLESAA